MDYPYRLCAGAVLFNNEAKVLICARKDSELDSWQLPQGGIEAGETPAQAAQRELCEETSITSVQLISSTKEAYRYTFPPEVLEKRIKRGMFTPGQDIYFSLFKFIGSNSEINLNTALPEFKKYEWVELEEAVHRVVWFKQEAYQKMADAFRPFIG